MPEGEKNKNYQQFSLPQSASLTAPSPEGALLVHPPNRTINRNLTFIRYHARIYLYEEASIAFLEGLHMIWKEMTAPYKILRVISMIFFAICTCLFAYEIAEWTGAVAHWETGSIIFDFLIGIVPILEGIIELKKSRGSGILWIFFGSLKLVGEAFFLILL